MKFIINQFIIFRQTDDFLDENTITTISKLLDKSGKWRQIAENLGFQSIISVCEQSDSQSSSPSAILLNNVEVIKNPNLFFNINIIKFRPTYFLYRWNKICLHKIYINYLRVLELTMLLKKL